MRQGWDFRPTRRFAPALLAAACTALFTARAEAQAGPVQPPATPAATERDKALPDIVVTAERRPELLQRTPVSVVALTAQELESRSVTNLRTLQNFVPNLTFAPSQNVGEAGSNVFIRGIGQEDFGIGAEPGVGFYVDGVYYARSLGTLMNLVDIDRIEVLRGPQGTLFGKNAIGGVINIFSIPPQPGRERRARLILGNYDRVELRTVANEPLSDRLFMRLAIGLVSRDGYLRRLAPPTPLGPLEQSTHATINSEPEGDDRSQAVRLQLRWLITGTLTADVTFDGSRKRDTQGAIHVDLIDPRFGSFPDLNRLIRLGRLPGPILTNDLLPASMLDSYAGNGNNTNQDLWGASAVITKELGASTLKFIGAYRGLRSRIATDVDGLYFNVFGNELEVNQHQFSGELQLNGVAGGLTYTAGLFALGERAKLLTASGTPDVFYACGCFYAPGELPDLTADPRQLGNQSYAGYAQGTYQVMSRLSATLGARFSHERKTLEGQSILLDANLRPTDTLLGVGSNKHAWNSFTYRAGLEYQATAALMAYGSIAKGYKSGGFNVRGAPNLPNLGFYSYKPETALTYEVGLRSDWLDRRLRLNATLFHTSYQDIQLRQQTIVAGEFTTLIENAAKARIDGAEVELMAVPLRGLALRAAYGHLAPKYLDVGRVAGLALSSRFQRTPRNSFSGSVNYGMPLRSGALELHGDYSYRSKEQFQILAAINDQKGYGLLAARVAFRAPDDRWSVALFGTNLTDERYRNAGRGTLIRQAGLSYSSVGMPRQFGVQVATRF